MKIGTHLKSLYRSPLKTALTLLLLAAAAFLFLYNLSEYSVADREYREARDEYEGVLTVEEAAVPENSTVFDCFLMTDETGRTASYGAEYYDKETELKNTAEIIIAKNRHGSQGVIKMNWLGQFTKFRTLEEDVIAE